MQVKTLQYFFALNKNADSQAIVEVSRAYDFGANGPRIELRPLPPIFGKNLGTCATCERIGKKRIQKPVI